MKEWTWERRHPCRHVFSVPAASVAQTCSLLYRRFLTCHLPHASNVLPIANRRYGRLEILEICATLNRLPLLARCVIPDIAGNDTGAPRAGDFHKLGPNLACHSRVSHV